MRQARVARWGSRGVAAERMKTPCELCSGQKTEEKMRKHPERFLGTAKWDMFAQTCGRRKQVPPQRPTMRTEIDIGSQNPETTAVSGFCYAILQSEIQKIAFP